MTDTYLIDIDVLRTNLNILNEVKVEVIKSHYPKPLVIHTGENKVITIYIHQYLISTTLVNNRRIEYNISIPSVIAHNGKPMKMLARLKRNTDIGLSNLLYKIEDDNDNDQGAILESTDLDYRNNLLLTSHNAMGIINVMTDKNFINELVARDKNIINKLIHDKKYLHKVLSKAFVTEVVQYTDYHKIVDYSYAMKVRNDNFNLCNVFTYEKCGLNFVHITFNMKQNEHIDDIHVRGYNFIL